MDDWKHGRKPEYFGTSYLTDFFEIVTARDDTAIVVTSLPGDMTQLTAGNLEFVNLPKPPDYRGFRYHMANALWTWQALRVLAKAGAELIVLTDAQDYWFLTRPLRSRGIRFVNALHTCIWPPLRERKLRYKLLLKLTEALHYRVGDPTIAASRVILDQHRKVSPAATMRRSFLPIYDRGDFEPIIRSKARADGQPFTVFYAGRIVDNKGVFDLVDIAAKLRQTDPDFQFRIIAAGEGPDLESVRSYTARLRLDPFVSFVGFCGREKMKSYFACADCVIVPSRSELEEGYAMIVAEGAIAELPVITSKVCPALEDIREAALEVEPDNVEQYAKAILDLARDKAFYDRKVRGAESCREQYFDAANGYRPALAEALSWKK